jgi:hypothetical protein
VFGNQKKRMHGGAEFKEFENVMDQERKEKKRKEEKDEGREVLRLLCSLDFLTRDGEMEKCVARVAYFGGSADLCLWYRYARMQKLY